MAICCSRFFFAVSLLVDSLLVKEGSKVLAVSQCVSRLCRSCPLSFQNSDKTVGIFRRFLAVWGRVFFRLGAPACAKHFSRSAAGAQKFSPLFGRPSESIALTSRESIVSRSSVPRLRLVFVFCLHADSVRLSPSRVVFCHAQPPFATSPRRHRHPLSFCFPYLLL